MRVRSDPALGGGVRREPLGHVDRDDREQHENGRDDAHARRLLGSRHELASAEDAAARSRVHGRFHVELAAAAQSARLTREQVALQTEVGALMWTPAG